MLEEKLNSLEASVKGGVALPADVLRIRAEISKLAQQMAELEARKQAAVQSLGLLTGQEIKENSTWRMPEVSDVNAGIDRPELMLFKLQSKKLETQSQLLGTRLKPSLAAFAQAGVGYPNPLNFFDNSSSPYYQAGLRLQWQFWDWRQTQREQQQLNIRQQIVSTEEENLERNIRIRLEQQEADIQRYAQLMQQDEEIIRMQEEVRRYASRQLDQGVITSTDYLQDVHAEQSARLNHSLHQIQWIQAKVAYLTEKGLF